MDEVTKYVQLRLLFQASFQDIENVMIHKDMAFVHMYKELPSNRLSNLVNCKHLAWADTSQKQGRQVQEQDPCFLIVDVANILHVIHVVPNFLKNSFFVNKYKF
jgi:hypothetical protein